MQWLFLGCPRLPQAANIRFWPDISESSPSGFGPPAAPRMEIDRERTLWTLRCLP
jgi:hypothetical protein